MILKKMISICFLFVLAITASLWIDRTIRHSFEGTEIEPSVTEIQDSEEVAASMFEFHPAKYYLAERDGKIAVYQAESDTLYFETSISTDRLSEKLRTELNDGIFFTTEKDLYEFLENYSS